MADVEEKRTECPLCIEEMDGSDLGFKPCPCGYQICLFCFNRLKEKDKNSVCPACRRIYRDEDVRYLTVETDSKGSKKKKNEKKEKEKETIPKVNRNLENLRVIKKNLVYIAGVPSSHLSENAIRKIFEKFGKITRINVVAAQANAYIWYASDESARKAVIALDKSTIEDSFVRVMLGLAKYCTSFINGIKCRFNECLYLHELASDDCTFTAEEVAQGKHYMKFGTAALAEKFPTQTSKVSPTPVVSITPGPPPAPASSISKHKLIESKPSTPPSQPSVWASHSTSPAPLQSYQETDSSNKSTSPEPSRMHIQPDPAYSDNDHYNQNDSSQSTSTQLTDEEDIVDDTHANYDQDPVQEIFQQTFDENGIDMELFSRIIDYLLPSLGYEEKRIEQDPGLGENLKYAHLLLGQENYSLEKPKDINESYDLSYGHYDPYQTFDNQGMEPSVIWERGFNDSRSVEVGRGRGRISQPLNGTGRGVGRGRTDIQPIGSSIPSKVPLDYMDQSTQNFEAEDLIDHFLSNSFDPQSLLQNDFNKGNSYMNSMSMNYLTSPLQGMPGSLSMIIPQQPQTQNQQTQVQQTQVQTQAQQTQPQVLQQIQPSSQPQQPQPTQKSYQTYIPFEQKKVPCKYYLSGKCKNGDKCSFLHEKPSYF